MSSDISLPVHLLEQLKTSKKIFLSVNPVIAFSDVLIALEKKLVSGSDTVDIVSLDKLSNLENSNSEPAIVACGDLPLKELPSYLRGTTATSGEQDSFNVLSTTPWLALRVHVSTQSDHVFQYLSSTSLEKENISLNDSSWTNFQLLEKRFAKSKIISSKGESIDQLKPKLSNTKFVGSDLEFIE